MNGTRRSRYEVKQWNDYFVENFQVTTESATFNVYYSPPSKLSSPVFAFHHGAGSSGLSFALLAKILRQVFADQAEEGHIPGIISYDIRYHGRTKINNSEEKQQPPDYSLATLANDFVDVINNVYELKKWTLSSDHEVVDQGSEQKAPEAPPLILVGHSLGGSVITTAANMDKLPSHIIGAVVLDVVEGSAVEALQSMNMILSSRPKSFVSLEKGIEWHVRSLTIRNRESACVSVPGLLSQGETLSQDPSRPWTWITDLRQTESFWPGWFKGLSARFLAIKAARLLILAGTDRLDKDLMIGQMQGKYQLIVFQDAGHFLHEDAPDKTALALMDFWIRNDRPQQIIPTFGAFRK